MAENKRAADEDQAVAPGDEVEEAADDVLADIDELGAAKRERDEYLELAQRTRADFENYRKRAAREAEEARTRSKAELTGQLIPIVDNLERALEVSGDEAALVEGVKLIYRDLRELLERAGVEAYDPAGERFDPAWHEALQTRPAEGAEPGQVIETLDKGYRLNGQALRPARVVVSE
ncbi:MAG: nucleotide exchange factor GrpE [Solirubrobacterales bacterium]